MDSTYARYSRLMMLLHWGTAVLVVIAYLLSEGARAVRIHPSLLHFSFGFAVLILVAPRLVARALGAAPPPQVPGNPWLHRAAKAGHWALYVLLVAVPISGWYAASRLGAPAWLFGITLPPLTHVVSSSAGAVGELHQVGGNLILILAGLHAAAALWHQFVVRDHTLQRMIPF